MRARLKTWRAETGALLPTKNPDFDPLKQDAF
jgi:hypothetical protein